MQPAPHSKLQAHLAPERLVDRLKTGLSDAVHEFDTSDRDRRTPKAFEAQHGTNPQLHVPVVLFDQVVQIF
jgi:hypothetical protein